MNFDAMFVEMFEPAVWGESCKDFNLRPLAAQITMGHLRGDRLRQKLPGKKLFQKKKLRQKVILEWKKEIAIMHMYPIQTVGSSCPTFSTSATKKHNVSTFFTTFLYFVPHFYDNLVSKAIQKYLYKGCNFYPVLSCVQKLKFHHAPKDIGCWKFAYLKCLFKFSDEKFVELFQFFIIKPPSAPSDKGLEHTIRKPLCMEEIWI